MQVRGAAVAVNTVVFEFLATGLAASRFLLVRGALFFIVALVIITVTWYLRPLCRPTFGVAFRNRRVPRCFAQPLSSIIGTHENSHDLRCGR